MVMVDNLKRDYLPGILTPLASSESVKFTLSLEQHVGLENPYVVRDDTGTVTIYCRLFRFRLE